jgi:adenylate kinase family enzyme
MQLFVVLSGAVGSGKSTLARSLQDRYGARIVNTRQIITALTPGLKQTREALQAAGEALDAQVSGTWVADGLEALSPIEPLTVLDAARTSEQVDAIRVRFPNVVVKHVHLSASEAVMGQRYEHRARPGDEQTTYAAARANATEAAVGNLAASCDPFVDTSAHDPEGVVRAVAAGLEL